MRAERLLTAKGVADRQPGTKPFKMSDGGGLHCLVQPNGAKLWRYRYEIAGREKMLALGQWPTVSLADARKARDTARELVARGGDPSAEKKAAKREARGQAEGSTETFGHFAGLAKELARQTVAPATFAKWELHIGYAVAKWGTTPIASITAADVLDFLRSFQSLGTVDTSHSIRRKLKKTFAQAKAAGVITSNPADIEPGILLPQKHGHKSFAAITDAKGFGELLRRIDGYQGQPATVGCLKLAALCFVRPGEIRQARWAEFDLDGALWTIPAERMKTVGGKRYAHVVPLASQAVAILRELQALYGAGEFVFPALGRDARPLSENTMNVALRGMGYGQEEMTGHGFRASANTLALETLEFPRWISDPSKVVDRQLAHLEPDDTKRAYDRAKFLDARTWLMQAWADQCDAMKSGGKVVPMRRGKMSPAST